MPNDVDSSPLTELDSEEELEDDEGHAEEMKNEKNEKQDTLPPLPLPLPLPLYRADSDSTILRPPATPPRRKVQSGMCFSFRAISEDPTHYCWHQTTLLSEDTWEPLLNQPLDTWTPM